MIIDSILDLFLDPPRNKYYDWFTVLHCRKAGHDGPIEYDMGEGWITYGMHCKTCGDFLAIEITEDRQPSSPENGELPGIQSKDEKTS